MIEKLLFKNKKSTKYAATNCIFCEKITELKIPEGFDAQNIYIQKRRSLCKLDYYVHTLTSIAFYINYIHSIHTNLSHGSLYKLS